MKKRKVAIIEQGHEKISYEGIKILKENAYELFKMDYQDFNKEKSHLKQYEAIMVRGATINRDMIESFPELKIIARCGVGLDNIDIEAASDNNVYVCNVPDANITSVAEHVVGLMLNLSRHVLKSDQALREGHFDVRNKYIGTELKGKTVGIIGYGQIGQSVAKKCVYGFGMNVLVYDPFIKKERVFDLTNNLKIVNSMDDVTQAADYITLHFPYTPELHHVINESTFKKMKSHAYLINCARGGLVDEAALAKSIQSGEIAGAGIDVFELEPPLEDNNLWGIDNVIVTPHIAASTKEALSLMSIGAAKEINRVFKGNKPKNSVNFSDI